VSPIDLAARIRDVPNFPKKGIVFKDITTLLKDPEAFRSTVDELAARVRGIQVDAVVGMESRGFIFAAPLAYLLGAGFVPVRKLGRLPAETVSAEYELEYGTSTLEMHVDALRPGQRVLVVDDLLATGGTVSATIDLIEQVGAQVEAVAFLVELLFLRGRERLEGRRVVSLIQY
jgi:adenine phosphoribosyltransferase